MRTNVEIYKGIEFVRISSLTEIQKAIFWQTFDKKKIIKILKNDALLNDCIQHQDYSEWMTKHFNPELNTKQTASESLIPILKFA